MQPKPKVGILTTFSGSDEAYSLVVVVKTQLQMLLQAEYYPVLFVCPPFTGEGIWADNHIEVRRTVNGDADHVDICTALRKMIGDIDVMICHDIVFLSQHAEWAKAVRILAKEFPNIKWLHWQHSRGDHSPIDPVLNSEFCYPNKGDLTHVADINSTTIDKVHYVPHPLDFAYLGWNELAIRIAEDYDFPFVDISMIYPTRLDRQKQVEKAMRMFSGFKKAKKSVCLLVADAYATGDRFKEYKKDCMELAKELGFTDKEFAFLGEVYEECTLGTPRQTVKALFEMSNIFMQVSTSETSSLVAMEAVMAGNMLVLNADFQPIHHLYGKAITFGFGSIFHDTKYYRNIITADGQTTQVEDPQLFFDDQARDFIIPVMNTQMTIALKKQQLRERWPSKVMKDYLEPLLLKDWHPEEKKIKCIGDPEVTAIICSLDNLEMLKRQIPVLMKECGHIIVVNNGSKDGTKEWLEENPVEGLEVINRENHGAGAGRNAGLALWDTHPTTYTLMLDGGILPPYNGVRAMKNYLLRHPEVLSVSPEIASCYTTDESQATLIYNKEDIDDADTFFQKDLSGTAYCLCRAEAWTVRFNEDGPYGEPGWGVDDNDMAYRWRERDMLHTDFMSGEGMILFRRASGSFQRLYEETGIWPNQYGSGYEKRYVKLRQDYPQYQNCIPEISCIVLGWNEFPMIQKVVKTLHDEFREAKKDYEIIVINNGSTDDTQKWIDEKRYRQHHGTAYIDLDGNIIQRTPENEEYWTGDFIPFTFDTNVGTGAGFNKGFSMARGKFIFYICGDMLPVKGSVIGLYQWLIDHPEDAYAGVNAWMNTKNPEEVVFNGYTTPLGLGNYGYSYAMIRREVIDNGVKFADEGPFEGPGAGYEDAEFANLLYSKGYKAVMFNDVCYYHQRRDGSRSGLDTREDSAGVDERKKYLSVKWNEIGFDIIHYHEHSPERHIRRVAMMNNLYEGNPGPAGFLAMALRKIGCEVDQFNSRDDVPSITISKEGDKPIVYDNFIFVDDSDLATWTCPEWAHPSIFWAIDMYNPSCWPYAAPEIYLERMKTFDKVCATSKSAVDYCIENGLNAFHVPHAANEDYHRFIPIREEDTGYTKVPEDAIQNMQRHYDWIAVWSNYGDRETYSKIALEKFPGGWLASGLWGDEYPRAVSQAKCALSMSRGFEYPARVVETMMIGTPLVSRRDRFIDMFFVENEHYRGFSSPEEMLEQIQWVLDHGLEAREMADKARKLVLSQHRYYHRALRMLAW